MRGTKRFATSDSTPIFNSNDSFLQSKRVIMGSPFDAQRAEPSNQQKQLAPLDTQRAESSRQHVRALNTQFASWVQAQLQDHPDELWDDGVQDYLNHAKNIVEKFSDVVNWLKANAGKVESLSELGSNDTQKKPGFEVNSKENNNKLLLDKPVFPPAATSTNLGTSWSSGLLFSNNKPFTFGGSQVSVPGNQNSVPSNHDASNDGDAEEDVEQPSSPSVKKSEEKGINVVHEVKCKLYVKSSDPADKDVWKDKGMGQLCIKCKEGVSKGSRESKPTIVVRNDVGKVLLNALLYPGIKTNMQKNAVVAIFHTSSDGDNDAVVARTFLMRTKTEEDRNKLAAIIQEYAPSA
ncbi:Pleckstrin-like proteiny (PH) domain superfamily protein [Abeliophyllum distichum]|uniref:Pleckstrin-like proteiny (PH) domain superfamily protein n=1 Tax=Abeliophyllum distichum TaxID=126358 RepID=A0ABD1TVN9_9LAMI